jgi:hypothetical protein
MPSGRYSAPWQVVLLALISSCSGETSPGSTLTIDDVVGDWCGKAGDPACAGDEAMWLELRAVGGQLTGQLCENPGRDCNAFTSAKVEGDRLTFSYTFGGGISYPPPPALPDGGVGEAGPPTVDPGDRVDGDFTVHGTTMTGTLFSTKCDCTANFTFYKQ